MPDLEREMAKVLLAMLFVSEGTTGKPGASHGACESRPPAGSSWSLVEFWKTRWEACESLDAQEACVGEATAALELALKAPEQPEDQSSEDAWIIEDGENHHVDRVAERFNTTPTRVRRVRVKADRDSEWGVPLAVEKDKSHDRVLNLAAQGCTLRQIGMQTGVSKTQVARILKEAA